MAAPQEVEPHAPPLVGRLAAMRSSRLVRQNVILFVGGLMAGAGGFVYHAIAAHWLGTAVYGEVAALIAVFSIAGNVPTLILVLVLARYSTTLQAVGDGSAVRHIVLRTTRLVLIPCLFALAAGLVLAVPGAAFLKLKSPVPVFWLATAIATIWLVAIPRGALQGLQRFPALSLNLSSEMLVRTVALVVLLAAGLAVTGSMVAVLVGALLAYALGMFSLRGILRVPGKSAQMRAMAIFSLTAAAGTLGIQFLFNTDVILAKHYLADDPAGLYGGLNKIATIVYFGTLSVSQVMFPRVVEAIAKRNHPGRLLLLSAGITCLLGGAALALFAIAPRLLIVRLYGETFLPAAEFMLAVGVIGLALSLNNLLVQFFMAAHDRVFVPILGLGCLLEASLIVGRHAGVGEVVSDVLGALLTLLAALTVRCVLLMPKLHPEPRTVLEEVGPKSS